MGDGSAMEVIKILDLICCPECQSIYNEEYPLALQDNYYSCENNHVFQIKNGVPDLRAGDNKEAFSANNYSKIHDTFQIKKDLRGIEKLDLNGDLINGKIVLLAGTGMGTELFCIDAFNPKLIVAIDYGDNIRRFMNLKFKNTNKIIFLQADILNLPFKSDKFDFVFNSGVMQHIRSPELGFRQLHRGTIKNGIISIGSIYDQSLKNRLITITRWRKMYHKKDYNVVYNGIARRVKLRRFFLKFRLGLFDRLLTQLSGKMVIPFGLDRSKEDSINQAMDFYYPEYRHIIDEDEILCWFREVGIENVRKGLRQYLGQKS